MTRIIETLTALSIPFGVGAIELVAIYSRLH